MMSRLKQTIKGWIGSVMPAPANEPGRQAEQVQLATQYRLMKHSMPAAQLPSLGDVGFKVYSQFEEDGILLYIFSLAGSTNKRVVEICAGDGMQCMAANLIIHHGWNGLLFEGDAESVKRGVQFFAAHPATWLFPPIFKQAWLTRENVNQLITENGFSGEIDLLSLDIDGNDYHIMEAITAVQPRVIICETQNVIPGNLALTIPYRHDFNRMEGGHSDFMGVSLLAMKKLLHQKGYRLIGAHRFGFNVFFMRHDVGTDYFPEVSVESVHDNAYTRYRQASAWEAVQDMPWMEV